MTGTGEPGSTINVYDGNVLLGTATVTEGGSWSYRPDGLSRGPLAEGHRHRQRGQYRPGISEFYADGRYRFARRANNQ